MAERTFLVFDVESNGLHGEGFAVGWVVQRGFLAACIDDHRSERELDGPYPLIDIASVRLAVGLDPLATCARRPDELPEHNPLADARQSARLLMEALSRG